MVQVQRSVPTSRTILETHSETILISILLAIANGELDRSSVALYWVRQRTDGTSAADLIPIDAKACLGAGWPPDVFRAHAKLTQELIRLRR